MDRFELSVPVGVHRIANDNLAAPIGRLFGHRVVQGTLFVTLAQNGLKVKLLSFVGFSVLGDFGGASEGITVEDKAVLQLKLGFVVRVIFNISDLLRV